MIKQFIATTASAIMLAGALIFPYYLCVGSFLFLVPLFYYGLTNKLSFTHGFLWGTTFFIFHSYASFVTIMNNENKVGPFLALLIIIIFYAIQSGLWFYFFQYLNKKINPIISLTVTTWLFFVWISFGSLFFLGDFIGYPFSFPLLPLAAHPKLLFILPYAGLKGTMFLLILLSMSLTLLISRKNKYMLLLFFSCSSVFLIGFFVSQSQRPQPPYLSQFGHIVPHQKYTHPLDIAQDVYYKMKKMIETKPTVQYIFMPESSYNFALNKDRKVIKMWYNNALYNNKHLFIGASYKNSSHHFFNSLYWIYQGNIKQVYNKSRLMPFLEYIPWPWSQIKTIKNLFLQSNTEFCSVNAQSEEFFLSKDLSFEPYICAEIFFGKNWKNKKKYNHQEKPLLLIVSDISLSYDYQKNLMLLWAKAKSIELQRDIFYIGYYFAKWISKNGSIITI